MKYAVKYTARFKKDFKLMKRRGKDINRLLDVIDILKSGKDLPQQYHDHPLQGNYKGHRDCHIEPDWILIYYRTESTLVLTLTRTGSHSDIL